MAAIMAEVIPAAIMAVGGHTVAAAALEVGHTAAALEAGHTAEEEDQQKLQPKPMHSPIQLRSA